MIKVSAPEFLIAASCVLFCVGQPTAGIVFVSLGVAGAIARVALENAVRNETLRHEQELRNTIASTINSVIETIVKHASMPVPMGYGDADDDDTSIN